MSSSGEANQPAADADKAKAKAKAKAEPKHWLEYAIFVFVIATAIATGFAAYYTRRQALTAADTEQRQLRAYLGISSPVINEAEGVITLQVSNGGQTPATNISGGLNNAALIGVIKIPTDFSFPEGADTQDVYQSFGHVLPQKTVTMTFKLDPKELDIFKKARTSGTPLILIYGHFEYFDIFGAKQSCTFAFYALKGLGIVQAERHNDCT